MIQLVDSHCHLDMLDQATTIDDYIHRAKTNGVVFFLNVGVTPKAFQTNLNTALKYSDVATTVGLHPNHHDESIDEATLIQLAQHEKVIGIGETGLDYFRSEGDLNWQRDRFRAHIRAAIAVNKPLIIHTRAAKEDTIAIMQEENASIAGGVMHCFTEDWEMAKKALDLGFYISFSGIITFKNAEWIRDVAKKMPLDRILVETDCPYLAPVPHRGKPNEPAYVYHTAETIATLRQITLEALASQTTQNFFQLFKGAQKPHDI